MHKLIGWLAAAALSAGAAQAATLTTSATQTALATNWAAGDVTLSLQQFNPLLGTLNSVTLVFSGALTADYDATSLSTTTQFMTGTLSGSMTFAAPGTSQYTLMMGTSLVELLAPGASTTGQMTAGTTSLPVLPGILAAYTGTGSFDVGVLADAVWSLSSTGDLDGGASTTGTATVQVTYDYTAATRNQVPEPGALALVGLALGAAGAASRRSRRRTA